MDDGHDGHDSGVGEWTRTGWLGEQRIPSVGGSLSDVMIDD